MAREKPEPGTLRRGSRLGKYLLEKRLGRGAFADVWRVRDTVERRAIALKIISQDAVREFGRDQIEQEARIATRLTHPNIVAVRNADWVRGRFVIATELAHSNLAEYRRARRSTRIALSIVLQIASGLAYAHSRRVMHRDVKPQNLLIFDDDRAALSDFGASCFAKPIGETYSEVGTLGYLAPEQAYGRPGYASDVFSLGLISYELLTGKLLRWPFEWPERDLRTLQAKIPEKVIAVVRKAVQFQPRRRFTDAGAFYAALRRSLEQAPERQGSRRGRRRSRKPVPSPLAVEAELFRRHHGTRLGMRYFCHRCDGPVAEEMIFCPWCGAEDNSFREITDYPLVCYACDRGVRPEWNYCPWCYQGRFTGNGRPPRPDRRATRRCSRPGCAGELRPFMRYCPLCKKKVLRPWKDPELEHRCPRCRWSVSRVFWRYCPWCGKHEPRAGRFARVRKTTRRA
jgi:serine/threonine-protein kinase